MLRQYNERLRSLSVCAQRRKQVDERIDALYAELKALEREYEALVRASVQKENECGSIEIGWKAIVYGVLGRRRAELEKARAGFEEIERRRKAADDKAGNIRREMDALEAEKQALAPQAGAFRKLLREKYEAMRRYGLLGGQILHREEQLRRIDEETGRIKGFLESGDAIMDQLRRISNHLNQADNAGQRDMLGGGSSGYSKHWHLSDAQSEYRRVQGMIREFGEQINGEAAYADDIAMEMSWFNIEMDVLFDNVFADWKILQRVRAAKAEFMKVYDQMRVVMKSLGQRKQALDELRNCIKEEIDALILAAE